MIRRLIKQYRRKKEVALLPVKQQILDGVQMTGVDAGSAEGLQPHWRAYEGVVDFYLFEPHKESFDKLNAVLSKSPCRDKFHIMPTGLSGKSGNRVLYKLNCPTGSSLYPIDSSSEFACPDDDYIYPVHETQIETRCLAEVLDEEKIKNPDIIKLDVQGAELEILQGLGCDRRKDLILVELEVNISGGVSRNFSTYKGAPAWSDIDELLVADGMRLLDLSVARAYRGQNGDSSWYQREIFDVYQNSPSLSAHVWETDVVYVRDWRELIASNDTDAIRKLVVALCGYRFFSEAYFIVERAEEAGLFDSMSAGILKSSIVSWHDAGRHFWHKHDGVWGLLRKGLRATRVSQLLRWKQYMWFDYPNG